MGQQEMAWRGSGWNFSMERKGKGLLRGFGVPILEVFKEELDVTLSLDLIFSGSGIQELMAGSFLPLHMGMGGVWDPSAPSCCPLRPSGRARPSPSAQTQQSLLAVLDFSSHTKVEEMLTNSQGAVGCAGNPPCPFGHLSGSPMSPPVPSPSHHPHWGEDAWTLFPLWKGLCLWG